MPQSLLRSPLLMFMTSASLFGLFLTTMLALNPPTMRENFPWRKPLIGSLFGTICMLGITAIFLPKQCSTMLNFAERKRQKGSSTNKLTSHGNYPLLQGHHPNCTGFSAHVIRVNDKTLCAACTGLLLGALIALAGAILYFFDYWHINQSSALAVFIGALGVGFGLLQLSFRGLVRLLLNTLFVLGAFLVLIGIDALTQSLFVDLFLVVLIVFWLLTRILLSQWDHWRICYFCRAPCEIREKKRSVSAA